MAYHYDAQEHIFEKASAFEERMAAREEMAVEQPETITVLMVNPGERPYEMQVGIPIPTEKPKRKSIIKATGYIETPVSTLDISVPHRGFCHIITAGSARLFGNNF